MASEQTPMPGDLIEISRSGFNHWAVYIGAGEVIHVGPDSQSAGSSANSSKSLADTVAVVKLEKLTEVAGEDKWRVNNFLDDEYQVRDIAVIIKEARQQVGNRVPYGLLYKNCEHFVTQLRYGKAESRQANNAINGMAVGAGLVAAVGIAAAAGSIFLKGNKEKKSDSD